MGINYHATHKKNYGHRTILTTSLFYLHSKKKSHKR